MQTQRRRPATPDDYTNPKTPTRATGRGDSRPALISCKLMTFGLVLVFTDRMLTTHGILGVGKSPAELGGI